MKYGGLRFTNAQRLRAFGVSEVSARGKLLRSETQKHQRQNWQWDCPRTGLARAKELAQRRAALRAARIKGNGQDMSRTTRDSKTSGN